MLYNRCANANSFCAIKYTNRNVESKNIIAPGVFFIASMFPDQHQSVCDFYEYTDALLS